MSDEVEALRQRVADLEGRRSNGGCLKFIGRALLGLVGLLILFAAIGSCLPDPPPSDRAVDDSVYMAKLTVRAALRDPDSAKFGDLTSYRHGEQSVVCGTVNARNGFGGMTGEERFFVSGDVVMFEHQDREAFPLVWNRLCRNTTERLAP